MKFHLRYRFDNSTRLICSVQYSKRIQFSFGYKNTISLKAYRLLLKASNFTFMTLDEGAFFDPFNVPSTQVLDGFGIPVNKFTTDTVLPVLLSFTVSSTNQLTLVFSEPMNTASLQVGQLTFQDGIPTFVKSFPLSAPKIIFVDTFKLTIVLALLSDYTLISGNSEIFTYQVLLLRSSAYGIWWAAFLMAL